MSDPVDRKEYQDALGRLHNRVDEIKNSVTRQEAIVEIIKESSDNIHDAVFGNGKEGIITKIARMSSTLIAQGWLIGTMVAGLMALAFMAFRKGL